MTYKELKAAIVDIITDINPVTTEEAFIDYGDAEKAADKILSFMGVKDLDKNDDCCKHGVCTCGP